jgi:hypothetical protein
MSRIELLYVPQCPLVDGLRTTVRECLKDAGIAAPLYEREGDYPSPTLLVDGADVITGRPISGAASCRLDLPSRAQIRAALDRSSR